MIHFLRDAKNRTIIECEVYGDDLSSAISIPEYSYLLLESNDPNTLMWDFDELDNLRRIWFEGAEDDYQSMNEFVIQYYSRVAKKHNLNYVTD